MKWVPCWFFLLCCCSMSILADAIDEENNVISIAFATEPPDLSSLTSTDQQSFTVIEHVQEGLLTRNAQGRLSPGVAERWEINGKHLRFFLRKNAKWSDGVPVTADDFVYAWQTALAPETASQYAFILYSVKNAEAINKGEIAAEYLGVKATSSHILDVELAVATPYFLSLTSFATLYPIRRDFHQKLQGKYAAEPENLLANGPFVLTKWVHGASLRLEKNQHYWNAANVSLNAIDVPYITSDSNAIFNLFRDGQIVSSGLSIENTNAAMQSRMEIKSVNDGSVFYLAFNHRKNRITANLNFRKAIQAVYHPEEIVYKVIGTPGNEPAYSLFPNWLWGVNDFFYREHPVKRPEKSVEIARKYLEKAKRELALDELPPIYFLTGDSNISSRLAEYLQNLLASTLDIDLRIDKQVFKQRLEKMSQGDFDMVAAGWGPDYDDPNTFGDLFASYNMNNRGRYASEEYDRLVLAASTAESKEERMEYFAKMQDLIVDDVVIIPELFRGGIYVENPRISGVLRKSIGANIIYTYASIEPEKTSQHSLKPVAN